VDAKETTEDSKAFQSCQSQEEEKQRPAKKIDFSF